MQTPTMKALKKILALNCLTFWAVPKISDSLEIKNRSQLSESAQVLQTVTIQIFTAREVDKLLSKLSLSKTKSNA